ncbi:MAG: hypothetical protein ACJ71P_05205 [Nitrososphaeraceae archaeon]
MNRTQFTCARCGFCWSCHWLKEEMERISPAMVRIEVYTKIRMTTATDNSLSLRQTLDYCLDVIK